MLSNFAFFEITVITILAIWYLYFLFSLLYPKLKKARFFLAIVLILGSVTIKTVFCNSVYIVNDNNEIKEMVLIIPYRFPLNNGQYTILKPQPGLSQLWLVNNGNQQAWVESVTYGDAENLPLSRQLIAPHSASRIKSIEYFFQAPPKEIKTINPPVTQGWLHR